MSIVLLWYSHSAGPPTRQLQLMLLRLYKGSLQHKCASKLPGQRLALHCLWCPNGRGRGPLNDRGRKGIAPLSLGAWTGQVHMPSCYTRSRSDMCDRFSLSKLSRPSIVTLHHMLTNARSDAANWLGWSEQKLTKIAFAFRGSDV
jgi:hypothetical protein